MFKQTLIAASALALAYVLVPATQSAQAGFARAVADIAVTLRPELGRF